MKTKKPTKPVPSTEPETSALPLLKVLQQNTTIHLTLIRMLLRKTSAISSHQSNSGNASIQP
ncbi:MAG TPA: hypothetical protein VM012_13260 [Flavitalea sp.]|nr:hypothetical protein [Flavitalea sp.]